MKKYLLLLAFVAQISFAFGQDREASGLGLQGIAYISPVDVSKRYYGAYASVNLRSDDKDGNYMQWKFLTGLQFHEKVKIIDLGATLRFFPFKKLVYLGVSPYNARIATVKGTEDDAVPISIAKGYGIGHLGLQLPLGKNVDFEVEGNYNYFYESKAAGYSFSAGFVFYSNDLVNIFSKSIGGK